MKRFKKMMSVAVSAAVILSTAVFLYPRSLAATEETVQSAITAVSPTHAYILADTNTAVNLSDITITDGTNSVTGGFVNWTPADSNVTVSNGTLTATADGVHKVTIAFGTTSMDIYVVSKQASATEYVLYQENFDEVANGNLPDGWVRCDTTTGDSIGVQDGKLVLDGSMANGKTSVRMPSFLNAFDNYTEEADFSIAAVCGGDKTRYCSMIYRMQTTNVFYPYYQMTVRQNKPTDSVEISERTPTNAWDTPMKADHGMTLDPNTMYKDKVVLNGTEAKEYFNDTLYIDYKSLKYASGGCGLLSGGSKSVWDNIKVSIQPENLAATTVPAAKYTVSPTHAYVLADTNTAINLSDIKLTDGTNSVTGGFVNWTPADSGVTVSNGTLTATADGVHKVTIAYGTTSMDIYVASKQASATEYVLYQENFDEVANGSLPDGWVRCDTTTGDSIGVQDGKLVLDGSMANGKTSVRMPSFLNAFDNYTEEADFSIAAVCGGDKTRYCSMIYRMQTTNVFYPYYQMTVRQNKPTDSVEISERTPTNAWDTPMKADHGMTLDPNTMYKDKVVLNGTEVKEYFNDTLYIDYPSLKYASGGCGLLSGGSKSVWDNIKVSIQPENLQPVTPTTTTDTSTTTTIASTTTTEATTTTAPTTTVTTTAESTVSTTESTAASTASTTVSTAATTESTASSTESTAASTQSTAVSTAISTAPTTSTIAAATTTENLTESTAAPETGATTTATSENPKTGSSALPFGLLILIAASSAAVYFNRKK